MPNRSAWHTRLLTAWGGGYPVRVSADFRLSFSEAIVPHRIPLFVLFVALVMAGLSPAGARAADANSLLWLFQRTGHTTSTSAQTAIGMGDAKSWPVVFSLDNGTTQAYALSPVRNPTTNTFWSQIGSNILSGTGTLTAKSSSDGRVGVSLTASPFSSQTGSAIVGRRTTGFANPISNVQGLTFDQAGTLVTASADTLAGSGLLLPGSLPTVQSIAASPFGSIGVVTSSNGVLSYYEKSPVPGWNSAFVTSGTIFGGDLAIDSFGRPFVAYSGFISSTFGVHASHFDVMSGQWKTSSFPLPSSMISSRPTIAADGIGGIGLAWMATTSSGSSSLMYAYKNGVKDWALHTVTSFTVASGTASGTLLPQQRVGLDFDANNWPVISFLAGNSSGFGQPADIWLAYDPVVVPEPSSLMLAAMGLVAAGLIRHRTRR